MTAALWGDPLSCRYSWVAPADLASYADVVRHVARKVRGTVTGLESVTAVPEPVFAGATADAVRSHARRRSHDATSLHVSLRSVADAIHEHAAMLGRYRDALEGLRDLATSRGLEVRDHRIWPPPPAPPSGHTPQQYDTWVTAWRSYRTCFDLKAEIEAERREQSLELTRAVTAHTGALPEPTVDRRAGGHGVVGFGQDDGDHARRRGAEQARQTLEVHDALESALDQVSRLRQDHRTALDELHRLGRAGASEDELTAQAREVRIAAEALRTERARAAGLQSELAERIS